MGVIAIAHWAVVAQAEADSDTCSCILKRPSKYVSGVCPAMVQDSVSQQALALALHHIAGSEDNGNAEHVFVSAMAQENL